MNYTTMYCSNQVRVTDVDEAREMIDELNNDLLNFSAEIVNGDELILRESGTDFQPTGAGSYEEYAPESVLEMLQPYLESTLVVRSVGYTGLRHIPDAYQFVAEPGEDGEIYSEQLDDHYDE